MRRVYLRGLLGLPAIGCGMPDEPTVKTSTVALAQSVGEIAHCPDAAGAAIPFTREQRLSRFTYFLTERRAALLQQGATRQSERPALPGWYSKTYLLDPRVVINRLAYAINRYDSYLQRISAQMVSENLVPRSVSFGLPKPEGFKAPEEFGSVVDDATAAFQAALDAGNVWLTPGKTY